MKSVRFFSTLGILQTTFFVGALLWLRLFAPAGALPGIANTQNLDLRALPITIGDWSGTDVQGLGIRSQTVLQLDSYIRRVYKNSLGDEVVIYIGYWRSQGGDYQAAKHSPAICLPANGWRVEDKQTKRLPIGLTVNSLTGSVGLARLRFYYWFFSGKREYAQEWQALLQLAVSSLKDRRLDGGIVELSSPFTSSPSALEDFAIAVTPHLRSLLAK